MNDALRHGELIKLAAPAAVRALDFSADELLSALLNLAPSRGVQILDSGGARGDGDEARYLIAGFAPFETIEARGRELHIRRRDESASHLAPSASYIERGSLLDILDERLARYRVVTREASASQLPVAGACIASFSYDLARRFERLRSRPPASDDAPEPDAFLAFYDTLVVHDYAARTTHLVSIGGDEQLSRAALALDAAQQAQARDGQAAGGGLTEDSQNFSLQAAPTSARQAAPTFTHPGVSASMRQATSNFTRAEYVAAVERIREHIYTGDIYQANLTQRLTCPLADGDNAEQVFMRLRRAHPASFGAFLRRPDDTVVSASPERFLRVSAHREAEAGEAVENNLRRVEAWPIKGTQKRGAHAAEDARLRRELQQSAKDAAENVMIVDLMRNDLGRVCRYGSVEVTALCEVQEHPTLFHLVSKVRGALREGVTAGTLLRAAFPCGSITGAPKLRAMEIIDEVERAPRGLSMGAIGYFSFDGAIDLGVAIRTMAIRECVARFNVGGGIVAESVGESEYAESLLKARALLDALGANISEGVSAE